MVREVRELELRAGERREPLNRDPIEPGQLKVVCDSMLQVTVKQYYHCFPEQFLNQRKNSISNHYLPFSKVFLKIIIIVKYLKSFKWCVFVLIFINLLRF